MKKLLKTTGIMMLGAAVLFTGCKKDKDEKFSVNATANNPEWGVVVGGGEFDEGTEIVLAATANEGYHFVKWSNELTDNPLKLVVTKNESLIAYFAEGNGGNPGGTSDPQSITLSGTINENTTWKDLGLPVDYIVDGEIYLDGNALVTVDSGVTIMFTGTNGGIAVGENAGLKMMGTATKPIIFTGPANNQNVGAWNEISVSSKRNDNVWEYVTFKNGGSGDNVVAVTGSVSIKNCTIDGSGKYGLGMYGDQATLAAFENNTIKNCKSYPVFFQYQESEFGLSANNTFDASNGVNVIAMDNSAAEIDKSATLKNYGIPYLFLHEYSVTGSATLTIEAGASIKMTGDAGLNIYEDVTLIAEGSADKHIEISGDKNEKSYWNGVFYNSTKSASVMKYVDFKNGGKEDYAILNIRNGAANVKLTMENCSFSETENAAINIETAETLAGVSISGDTYTNCGSNVKVLGEYGKDDENGDYQTIISEGQTFDNYAAVKAAMQ